MPEAGPSGFGYPHFRTLALCVPWSGRPLPPKLPMAYRAFLLIDSYLYGFIIQEVTWRSDDSNISQVDEEMSAHMSPADYPHVVETMGHVMTMSVEGKLGFVYDTEFTAGLELVLDSLGRLRDTQGPQSSVLESPTMSADVVQREN